MGFILLEQGSDEWKAYRKDRIMATDVSVIVESNSFTTPLQLWEEKLGLRAPKAINDAMLRGQALEPEARKVACEITGINFHPCVYQSDVYPWAAASLDGLCELNTNVLEIKCPKEKTHLEALQGVIQEYYSDQMQWQMFVTQTSICYYFSYRPEYKANPFAVIEVKANTNRQEMLLAKAQEFYINMCTMQPPLTWVLAQKIV